MPGVPATRGPSAAALWANMAVIYLVWGSTYFGIAVAIETIPAFLMAAIRFTFAGLIVIAFDLLRHPDARRWPSRRQLVDSFIVGALLLGVGNGFVAFGQSLEVPSGVTAILIEMTPLWFALLGWLYFRQRLPGLVVGAIALGAVGTALLIWPEGEGASRFDPLGILVLLLAEVGWVHGSFYSQRRAQLPASALSASGIQMLAGGAVMVVEALVTGEPARFHPESISTASLLALGYLIAFGSMLAYTSYAWLLQKAPLSLVATHAYVNPVVAVALGTVFLHEPLGPRTIVAAAVILVAVAIIVTARDRLGSGPATEPPAGTEVPAAAQGGRSEAGT
ncbi:MAG TPA: EamA family transporter [Patescibacteria group bacterium]|nr:EamA family transporter [Patescibacteria group bacterium]